MGYLEFTDVIVIALVLLTNMTAIFVGMYCGYNLRLVTNGTLWGITVPASKGLKKMKTRSIVGLVIAVILFNLSDLAAIKYFIGLLMEAFPLAVLYAGLWLSMFVLAILAARKSSGKRVARETNAFVLGQLPFIQSIEARLDNAETFVVGFDGIALYDTVKACYSVQHYTDYRMGALSKPREVALLALYFSQKHHDEFSWKVKMETIPGTPVQSVVINEFNGTKSGYINGTNDTRAFKCYVFTRKH